MLGCRLRYQPHVLWNFCFGYRLEHADESKGHVIIQTGRPMALALLSRIISEFLSQNIADITCCSLGEHVGDSDEDLDVDLQVLNSFSSRLPG